MYIYIRVVRRALNLLRASFSPIIQYFSAVNVTCVSFSPIFQYFLTCMPCAMRHAPFVSHGFVRLGFVGHGFVRHGIVQRGFVRHGIVHPPEKLHFAKEEKGIETVALVRVLNKERLDSLGADLQIEKEQGHVVDRRLPRKGKLD